MTALDDRVAEALWIAADPWRQLTVFGPSVPFPCAEADDGDRNMYRQMASTVIEELGLIEETWHPESPAGRVRLVSRWWRAS
jgi:hypothetical protein